MKLSDFDYYFGSSFHYEGENYWGIDRLHHLEDRLNELNLNRQKSHSYIINHKDINNDLENIDFSQIIANDINTHKQQATAAQFGANRGADFQVTIG